MCVISQVIYCGGYSGGDPPLPIPNREVKPAIADGTAPPGGRVGSCRSSRSGPSHRRPGPFFVPSLLPSSLCQPRASCTGEPVAARGPVSGRDPRRQAWEGWSEAEGLPCKRPEQTFPGAKSVLNALEPPLQALLGGLHRRTRGRPRPREREGPAPTGVGRMERSGRFAVQTPGEERIGSG